MKSNVQRINAERIRDEAGLKSDAQPIRAEAVPTSKPAKVKVVSKVLGPIRCHKCQLKCRDAEHYLSHKCEPYSPPSDSFTLQRLDIDEP
jgi:hypothetical protein